MPWFKIDDKHHDHSKTRKALRGVRGKRRDAGAMGLWELAGSWSADNLQDGFVPTDELFRWDDDWEALAARLVAADYWEPAQKDGEEGFQFINWDEHQPMKADVEAKREAAKERMRNIRSGSRSRSGEVRANEQVKFAAGSPTPSRPDPTRPDPEAQEQPRKRVSRSTQLPDDFEPNDTNRRIAAERGLDLEAVMEQWADHHRAKGSTMKDWHAALNTWLRRERPPRGTTNDNVKDHFALAQRLHEREQGATIPFPQIGGGQR